MKANELQETTRYGIQAPVEQRRRTAAHRPAVEPRHLLGNWLSKNRELGGVTEIHVDRVLLELSPVELDEIQRCRTRWHARRIIEERDRKEERALLEFHFPLPGWHGTFDQNTARGTIQWQQLEKKHEWRMFMMSDEDMPSSWWDLHRFTQCRVHSHTLDFKI